METDVPGGEQPTEAPDEPKKDITASYLVRVTMRGGDVTNSHLESIIKAAIKDATLSDSAVSAERLDR